MLAQVRVAEVDTFLKGGAALDIHSVQKKPKVTIRTALKHLGASVAKALEQWLVY